MYISLFVVNPFKETIFSRLFTSIYPSNSFSNSPEPYISKCNKYPFDFIFSNILINRKGFLFLSNLPINKKLFFL